MNDSMEESIKPTDPIVNKNEEEVIPSKRQPKFMKAKSGFVSSSATGLLKSSLVNNLSKSEVEQQNYDHEKQLEYD